MTLTVLPTEGDAPLSDVASAIACAVRVLGVADVAELRSVLVRLGDRLVNLASVLRVGWPKMHDSSEPKVLEAGDITLIAAAFAASDVGSASELTDILGAWRPLARYSAELQFQERANIYREHSHGKWGQEPCWVLQVYEKTPDVLNRPVRRGPFLHADTGFFAEDVADAARQWLGDPGVREAFSILNTYRIVIRDARAWFQNLSVADAELSIEVATATNPEVFCTAITTDFLGTRSRSTTQLTALSARMPIALPATALQIYLTDREGSLYDQYSENEHSLPWGRSILNPPRTAIDPEYQELRDALEQGESETVEFKEWLPTNREAPKSYELLKTATALANAVGGVIYVGVTDDCEVIGTAKGLRREFGCQDEADLEILRNEYAQSLRRILNEGISPSVEHSIGWITHAGLPVLRIAISAGAGHLYQVVEDGAIYVRKGGSDKKASSSDLERVLVARLNQSVTP